VRDEVVLVDARPSDAIALALRVDCPIFIRDEVMETSRLDDSSPAVEAEATDAEEEVEWPEEIEDISDYKM
jgi:bifunctional DNase/RNase